MNKIAALIPMHASTSEQLRENLRNALYWTDLGILYVGGGTKEVYAVFKGDTPPGSIERVARKCSAQLNGFGYLRLDHRGGADRGFETIEQALARRPIDYDIPIGSSQDIAFLVCDICGGVGRHINPPCPD